MSKQDFYNHIEVIRSATKEIVPDEAWVLRTRQTLMMQVANSMPPVKISWTQRLYDMANSFLPMRAMSMVRRPIIGFLSIAGIITGASMASVSAAEQSIPGDLLYPVKIATEQTRLILTKSKTDKLKLKTEFVERRGQEIKEIANSDSPKKEAQLKQAAETLRQDLNTVNLQLDEVSQQESPLHAAEAAKLVDRRSSELAITLKDVKINASDEVRIKVAEAEAAAVNTGTQAVQVLIDSQQDPEAKDVVTGEELLHSINTKVLGLEQNIADAALRITGSSTVAQASSSLSVVASSSTVSQNSANSLMRTAHQSLEQTKQYLQENNLDQVKSQLGQTVKAIATMEASVAAEATASAEAAAASSTAPVVSPEASATSSTSSTSSISSSSTTSVK